MSVHDEAACQWLQANEPWHIVPWTSVEREHTIAAIASMEETLFGRGAWTPSMVAQELDAPARHYWLAVREHTSGIANIGGYAGYWYDGDDAELMTIGVSVPYQRQGLAARLLTTLIEDARQRGAARVLLEVRVDNDPALHLYRRFGFQRLGIRKRYYQPEGVDAYTMALELHEYPVGFASGATTKTRQ